MIIDATTAFSFRETYHKMIVNKEIPKIIFKVSSKELEAWADEDNEIMLTLAPQAIRDLNIGLESLSFRTSFEGKIQYVRIPYKDVVFFGVSKE